MRENAIFNVLYGEIFPHVNKLRLRTKSLNGTLLLLAHYLCIHFTEPCDKLKAIPFFIIFLHTPSPFMSRMKLLTSKRATPKPVFLKVNTVWRNLCAWRASGCGFRYMTINGKNIIMKIQQKFCGLAIQCSRVLTYINKLVPTTPPPYQNGSIFRGL